MDRGQILAAAYLTKIIAEQHHCRANRFERSRGGFRRIVEQADDAQYRRRENRAAFGFVVQADVAAGYRGRECAAGIADPAHGFRDLPHDLRPLWIAEVQVIGGADWFATGAGDIARRLSDGQHRALVRVEKTEAAVAVD